MSRRFQRRLCLLILLLLAGVWWIYSQIFRFTEQKIILKAISSDNDVEDTEAYKRFLSWKKGVHITNVKKHVEMEIISTDNNIGSTVPYPLVIRHIPKSDSNKQEKELSTTMGYEQRLIEKLREMLQGDSLSKDIEYEEDFIRLFLITNNYNVDKAYSKFENFLKVRLNHNYFFQNMNFDFTQNPAYRFATLLPGRCKDGSASFLFEIGKWNPDEVPLEHMKKILFIIFIQELRHPLTQSSGFNLIYDFTHVGFRYAQFATTHNLNLMLHMCLEVLPVKYTGIHLINMNFAGNLFLSLLKPFLPENISKILYIHSSAEELLDFIPDSSLPAQYGGSVTDYYMKDWLRKANEQHDNFPIQGQKNI